MKNMNLWLSALVLATVPFFTSQALIIQPNVQFKTFEQIQADALEKLNAQAGTLSQSQLRQQRLLNFTKDNDATTTDRTDVGRFKNRVNNGTRSERRTTARSRGIRRSGGKTTSRRTLTEAELSTVSSDENLTIRERLIKSRAEARAAVAARNTTNRHVSSSSDEARRNRIRALTSALSQSTFNSESEFETPRTFTNTERRSSFEFVPQPGQIWGR